MKKRLLSIVLTVCLLAGLLPTVALAANVTYYDWDSGTKQLVERSCTNPTEMTGSNTNWGTSGKTSWYVVTGSVAIGSRVTVSGNVHLILTDGCTLTVTGGIQVQDNDDNPDNGSPNTLTIYGQAGGTGRLTTQDVEYYDAAIGGNGEDTGEGNGGSGGAITINGGIVEANSSGGAAIGGGCSDDSDTYPDGCTGGSGGKITINGGTVIARSTKGAGIGGGFSCTGGSGGIITITGGSVTATGGTCSAGIGGSYGLGRGGSGGKITITGGIVEATSEYGGAGIGGGFGCGDSGSGGEITITGGIVTATSNGSGAGIGGGSGDGDGGSGGKITINGGIVTATSNGDGAGIGGGRGSGAGGSGGEITITGGTVIATSNGNGAGIGGSGDGGAGGTITITGGIVTATSNGDGAGIGGGNAESIGGAGGTITITGGTVTATSKGRGTGIGGGGGYEEGSSGTFQTNDGSAVIFASSIADQSGKTQGTWRGIIFEGNSGKVYGNQTLTVDMTIPEGTTLTVPTDVTLTNNKSIYVDGTLNGTVSGNGSVYYPLTVNSGTADKIYPYNSKTYGKLGSTITLTPDEPPTGKVFDHWETTDVDISENRFTMPDKAVVVTANYVDALTIDTQPTGGTITYGESKTLSVKVSKNGSATDDLTYQWYLDNKAITGANSNSYTTPANLGAGEHTYYCVISSDSNTVTSDNATVTVLEKEIGIQWGNTTFTYNGKEQQPTAAATGTVNGDTITLTVTGAQTDAGTYTATVTGISGEKAGNYTLPGETTTTFIIMKAEQSAPGLPTVKSKTWSSVTLKEVDPNAVSNAAVEYGIMKDGVWNWQDSPEFNGLSPNTKYTFAERYAETKNYNASSIVSIKVTTTSVPIPDYPPIVEQPEGGSVTVSPKNPSTGSNVTITPVADEGYEVDKVIITDQNGNPVEVTDNGDGTYSFTQPVGKVTIKVVFRDAAFTFVDVPADEYYYDAVLWAVKHGITEGTNEEGTLFSPDAPCTRAQVVTFLWRAAGCPTPKSSKMPFEDVVKGSYYETAVLWAVENGITVGINAEGTMFSPDEVCSRGQIVTFLWRSQGTPGAGTSNPFTDVAENDYHIDAVLWAVENGITVGTNDEGTLFSPDDDCTRAQIVTFLYRCLGDE